MATSLIDTSIASPKKRKITSKTLTWFLVVVAIIAAIILVLELKRIHEIEAFNAAVSVGKTPETDTESFEARFSAAYWQGQKGRLKESALLFSNLIPLAKSNQKAAIYHNIGNMYFLRGIALNGTNNTVKDEAEYLLRQAKAAYVNAIKTDNTNFKTKHNLDRIILLLPADSTPGVGGDEKAGLIMGNIPVGLP